MAGVLGVLCVDGIAWCVMWRLRCKIGPGTSDQVSLRNFVPISKQKLDHWAQCAGRTGVLVSVVGKVRPSGTGEMAELQQGHSVLFQRTRIGFLGTHRATHNHVSVIPTPGESNTQRPLLATVDTTCTVHRCTCRQTNNRKTQNRFK